MTSFARQAWGGLLMLGAATLFLAFVLIRYKDALPYLPYLSGWVLLAFMLVLTFYNGRKKLPFLPLGRSEGWLQFHIYAGWFTFVLFGVHVNMRPPTGWFEGILAILFFAVAGSGVVGVILSRSLSRRLTTRGGEVLYERIPAIRAELRERAEQLALKSVGISKATTIADFYNRHLQEFFHGPRNLWLHLLEVRRPLNLLVDEINDLHRYLNEEEKKIMSEMADLVRQKDGLDYHFAIQTILKGWLFFHIPLTYSLLIFSAAHIIIVFAFSGGAR
jgi:hypothetical protein